jgi:hypothetical protein
MSNITDDEARRGAAKPKSFLELAVAESVSPSDFLATYSDYARSGATISVETTVEVFNRVREQLTDEQLQQVVDDSFAGAMNQDRLGHPNLRPLVDSISLEDRSLHGTVNHLVEVVNYVRVGRLANDVLANRRNPSPVPQR